MLLPNASSLHDLRILLPRSGLRLSALLVSGLRCLLHTSLSTSSPTSLRDFKRTEGPPRCDQQKPRSAQPSITNGAPINHLSAEQLKCLQTELGDPEYWQLIYRLKAMPFVQAFSRLKLLLTGILLVGSPLSVVCCYYNVVSSEYCWFLLGATTFSFCTLCVFSHFSTKVVGVISLHKDTGLLRLGLLSFWGCRQNLLIYPDQILPPGDLDAVDKRTVRLAITGDAQTSEFPRPRVFYLSALSGLVSDRQLFVKYLGNVWKER
uniref:Transmembrane protein 186 n=2 Tax=Schistocephalus solidus TaxID=70667 RepID=A0A0X3NUE6_SCHSO